MIAIRKMCYQQISSYKYFRKILDDLRRIPWRQKKPNSGVLLIFVSAMFWQMIMACFTLSQDELTSIMN